MPLKVAASAKLSASRFRRKAAPTGKNPAELLQQMIGPNHEEIASSAPKGNLVQLRTQKV
jgi:hypothetical protein